MKDEISVRNGPKCDCWRGFESISYRENTGSTWVWCPGNSVRGDEKYKIIAYHAES